MLSLELLKFLVGKDVDAHLPKKEEVAKKADEDGVYRHKRYATVPIEIKE